MRVKDGTKNLNCFKNTWKYFGDKGIYLFLINLLPAILLPFTFSPFATTYYFFEMKSINIASISSLFSSMWQPTYSFWYIGLIGLVLLIFTSAITFGVVDRHMKVGEFVVDFRNLKSTLNYNVLTSLRFVPLSVISFEIFNIVNVLLYYLWETLFSDYILILVLSVLTLCVLEICMIYLMSWFILWPPFMLHTGLRASSAFKSAWSSMGGRLTRTAFSIGVIIIPLQAVTVVTAAFDLGNICRTVIDAVSYAVIIPYYITLMYNTFYEVTGTERMDIELKKKNIWAKK